MPAHSASDRRVVFVVRNNIAEVEEKCPEPYTVSLHPHDLETEIHRQFIDCDWRVASFGSRLDPHFMDKLVAEIAGVEFVTSNRIQTSILYGGFLYKRIRIVGQDPAFTVKLDPLVWNLAELPIDELRISGMNPEMARAFAEAELGFEFLQQATDLARELGLLNVGIQLAANLFSRFR